MGYRSGEDPSRRALGRPCRGGGVVRHRTIGPRYAQSFRMTGRLHRRHPELSRILLNHGTELAHSDRGLVPRALHDIRAAMDAGRFEVEDPDLAPAVTAGSAPALAALLHAQPDRDDANSSDVVTRGLLRQFGIPADEAERICSLELPDLDLVDDLVG
ncbi:hypothetical protein [Streptomyces sp. NPDC093591]|uniref:hypothetical protein n=1 Tax=Streptomyces sp. NPDC093591 TaxID=3366044 RepID=UPI00382877E0